MEKQKNLQLVIIAILAVCVMTMSVGFAGYARTLNITGTAKVEAASWNVQFQENSYEETTGTGYVTPTTTPTLTGTDLSFNVDLSVNQKYEFDVVIENTGTFDAKLTSITMSTLTAAQKEYLTYEITYAGKNYTETTTGLSEALAKTDGTATVHVKVEYKQPDDSTKLPSKTENVSLTAAFNFDQA